MTKLNKEQLKKLYDYGGTLSPKDWADMIDSVLEDSIYNKDSLPIVKITYEEVRELYYTGKMDPKVKYEFDYVFKSAFNTIYPVKDLKLYITPFGDLKAEGKVYDNFGNLKAFVADFKFDELLADRIYSDDDESINVYEDFKDRVIILNEDTYQVLSVLKERDFEYEILNNDDVHSQRILLKDVVILHTYAYKPDIDGEIIYHYIINKSGIEIQYSVDDPHINVRNLDINPVAALYNIQYENKFHYKLLDGICEDYDDSTMFTCNASVYGYDNAEYIDWYIHMEEGIYEISNGVIINSQLSGLDPYMGDYGVPLIVNNRNFSETM